MLDLLSRNSRFPQPMLGDLQAQMACVRIGEQRLGAIIDRFGMPTVTAARDRIYEQTERLEREIVAAIPDGVYTAEGCLDDDGIRLGEPVWVRVRVEVAGDRMIVDLGESSDLRGGPVNCGEAQAISACRVAFKLLVDPARPTDGGSFRALEVRVRRGSVLAAEAPAPCAWYFTPLGLLIDLVVKALAPVLPERAAAASYGDSMIFMVAGLDHRTGGGFFHIEPTTGGWGAWSTGRRRERAHQQRQRRDEGPADRGARDAPADAHDGATASVRTRAERGGSAAATASSASSPSTARRRTCRSGGSARARPPGASRRVLTAPGRTSSSTRAARTSATCSRPRGCVSGGAT